MVLKRTISALCAFAVLAGAFSFAPAAVSAASEVIVYRNFEEGTANGADFPATNGWYAVNAPSAGTVKYSADAAQTGNYGLDISANALKEFNTSVQLNYELTTALDKSALYRIRFRAKKTAGGDFNFTIVQHYQDIWSEAFYEGINATEWTDYSITLGVGGDYPLNDRYNGNNSLRFYHMGGDELSASHLFIDDFIMEKLDPGELIPNGSFEYPVPQNGAAIGTTSGWSVTGGGAVYSSAAKYDGTYGAALADGATKLTYRVTNFDPSKVYTLGFYTKTAAEGWKLNVLNRAGEPVLISNPVFGTSLSISEGEDYNKFVIGPEGRNDVDFEVDTFKVTGNELILEFNAEDTAGELYLDAVSLTVTENPQVEFTVDSVTFGYKDAVGSPETSLIPGKTVTTEAALKNDTIYARKAEVIAALYGADGILVQYATSGAVPVLCKKAAIAAAELTLPAVTDGLRLRVFIWDGTEDIRPLAASAALPGEYTLGATLSRSSLNDAIELAGKPSIYDGAVGARIRHPLGSGKRVTVLAVDKASGEPEYFGELVSGVDGWTDISFKLPPSASSSDFTLYIGGEDADAISNALYSFSGGELDTLLNTVNTVSFEAAISPLNVKIMESLGFYMENYENILTSSERSAVNAKINAAKPAAGYTDKLFAKEANYWTALACVKQKKSENKAAFTDLLTSYKYVYFPSLTDNDWIFEQLFAYNGDYQSIEELSSRIDELNALDTVNKALYSRMHSVIALNASALKMDLCANYSYYSGLSDGTVRDSISQEVVLAAASAPFTTVSALRDVLYNAIEKYRGDKGTTPGGSGGSSGSGKTVIRDDKPAIFPPAIVAPVIVTEPAQKPFNDLYSADWAEQSIIALYEKGVISGEAEGIFNPGGNVTKEQFVKMLITALEITGAQTGADFSDVSSSEWYYPYISVAKDAGIVNGISDDIFGTGTFITRQDMAVTAHRALALKTDVAGGTPGEFKDSGEIDGYASESVGAMAEIGIIIGDENGMFAPKANATRAQAAVIVYRLLLRLNVLGGLTL